MSKHILLFSILAMVALFSTLSAVAQEDSSTVSIEDAAVCQEISDRTPVGGSDMFPKEVGKVYCFTRVVGAQGDSEITHNWYYKGSLQASVVLRVGSANWRTWSSKTITPDMSGEWMVEVLSKEGVPLDSIIFFVQ